VLKVKANNSTADMTPIQFYKTCIALPAKILYNKREGALDVLVRKFESNEILIQAKCVNLQCDVQQNQ
jgi:hypothetical protein